MGLDEKYLQSLLDEKKQILKHVKQDNSSKKSPPVIMTSLVLYNSFLAFKKWGFWGIVKRILIIMLIIGFVDPIYWGVFLQILFLILLYKLFSSIFRSKEEKEKSKQIWRTEREFVYLSK